MGFSGFFRFPGRCLQAYGRRKGSYAMPLAKSAHEITHSAVHRATPTVTFVDAVNAPPHTPKNIQIVPSDGIVLIVADGYG